MSIKDKAKAALAARASHDPRWLVMLTLLRHLGYSDAESRIEELAA